MGIGRGRRWAAAALAGALVLCGLAAGDISFPGIVGEYNLQKGNLGFCAATAAVAVGVATLPGNALSFGGAACSGTVGYTLAESFGLPHWNAKSRAASGILLAPAKNVLNYVTCPGAPRGLPIMMFMRPRKRFEFVIPGYAQPSVLAPGVRYMIFSSNAGGCVYRHAASAPSPSPSAPPPRPESTGGTTRPGVPGGGDGLNIWVWLGPVLGAAATIVAALVTVFRCTRRDASDKAAAPLGSEGAPGHAEAGSGPSFAPPPTWAPTYPSSQ